MCTRDSSYQNAFVVQPITNQSIFKRNNNINTTCRYKGFYPSFTPTINSISVTSSVSGAYSLVYIDGTNFLPPCYGTTYVNFGNYTNLSITFYSPFNISFVVPINAPAATYNITVVNVYNGNFSPSVNQSYAGNENYSTSITYTIT
jgi:hypothetical protein